MAFALVGRLTSGSNVERLASVIHPPLELIRANRRAHEEQMVESQLGGVALPAETAERSQVLRILTASPSLTFPIREIAFAAGIGLPDVSGIGLMPDDEEDDVLWIEIQTLANGREFAAPFAEFLRIHLGSALDVSARDRLHATVRFV